MHYATNQSENETYITASFSLFKRARFAARKGFLIDFGEKDFLLAARKRKPLD